MLPEAAARSCRANGRTRTGSPALTGGAAPAGNRRGSQPWLATSTTLLDPPAKRVLLVALDLQLVGAARAAPMVGGRGLEPLTSCMSSMRSNQLS